MDDKEIREILSDHEHRLSGVERLQAVLSTQLAAILGVLKWIAGIIAVIAAALIIDFVRRGGN